MNKKDTIACREIAKMLNRHSQELMGLCGGLEMDESDDEEHMDTDPAKGERDMGDYSKKSDVSSMMIAFMGKDKKKK